MSLGQDTWCADSLQTGRFARGRVGLALALYRRLITPRSTLQGGPLEQNYGIDLSAYVGAVGSQLALQAVPEIVRAELRKDQRVQDIAVSATIATEASGLSTITLVIDVAPADESEPFTFQVSVSEVTAEFLGLAV